MRRTSCFNDNWTFHKGHDDRLLTTFQPGETVHLPHNCADLPYNYINEKNYQKDFTYQIILPWSEVYAGKEVVLVFDGAMADTRVYINGICLTHYPDGYTPFEARLTNHLEPGDNLVTVRLSGRENPDIPPFGGEIDYLTYAGIYRDVWLRVTDRLALASLQAIPRRVLDDQRSLSVACVLSNPDNLPVDGELLVGLLDTDGLLIDQVRAPVATETTTVELSELASVELWDIDHPVLYTLVAELITDEYTDSYTTQVGFRDAVFKADGFYLNGRPLKLIGLNRHQAYPYVGYAMGRVAQQLDAELLKNTLHCNFVRTSHYPQSHWFLDRCDQLGLLVFEELPGWQHIGNALWQHRAVENVRAMVRRDRNHPSIILWGVRINESLDSFTLYQKTNQAARELDSTRQTGGVRYFLNDERHLLEDVFTMNDFALGQEEHPEVDQPQVILYDQKQITRLDRHIPYLVTEFNGHMFPTKSFDQEQRQDEHVHRYLKVLNHTYGDPHIAGCCGWCMHDYNTHQAFGSGDGVCYHGVLDMFREPKFAAYAYASQCSPEREVILKPVTYGAQGERNMGGVLPLTVLTNCDQVAFFFGEVQMCKVRPDRDTYPHLPHPPVMIDQRHITRAEFCSWGKTWQDITLVGYIGDQEVARVGLTGTALPDHMAVVPDTTSLCARSRDEVRVMVRAIDNKGNKMPYFQEPVTLELTGPGKIIGPQTLSFRGGAAGFWVRATGRTGAIGINLRCPRLGNRQLTLYAE